MKLKLDTDDLCNKSGKQLNDLKLIKHNLKKRCPGIIHNTYIRSNFNYFSLIWMYCGKKEMDKIEKIIYRWFKFVSSLNHNYPQISSATGQLNIFSKCLKWMGIQIYKIKNGMAPTYLGDLIVPHPNPYNIWHNDKYQGCMLGYVTRIEPLYFIIGNSHTYLPPSSFCGLSVNAKPLNLHWPLLIPMANSNSYWLLSAILKTHISRVK